MAQITHYTGNAIPAPGLSTGAGTSDDEILFSAVGYIQKGVTLKPGQGVLLAGTFLKQDPGTKQYVKATGAAGVEGVLRKTVDTGTDAGAGAQVWLANILYGGTLKHAALSNANSGIADLTTVLGAQVNVAQGFFRF
jgi:hypothetical protein